MLSATDGNEVQKSLAAALEIAGRKHNELALSEQLDPSVRAFHSRPFHVLQAERFAEACLGRVGDSRLRNAALIGSIDQWIDSADALENPDRILRAGAIYSW